MAGKLSGMFLFFPRDQRRFREAVVFMYLSGAVYLPFTFSKA